jgi:hypothetical protein
MVAELKKGGFKENEKFYTEKELMHKYQLSYATVSHAVRSMTKDGYFIRRKGIGTFVNAEKLADMAEPVNSRTLFINDISRLTDKDLTPYSWYTFEQLQRGIIDTYEGPVSYLESSDMQSIMKDEEANIILLNPAQNTSLKKIRANYSIINLRSDYSYEHNAISRNQLLDAFILMNNVINQNGHTKVAFIGGDRNAYHSEWYAAYEIALRSFQIKTNEKYIIRNLPGSELDGYKAMTKILALQERPTAVVCDTCLKAIGAMHAISDSGLNIPEDISIAAIGYLPEIEKLKPRLTVMNTSYYNMGKMAVELLNSKEKNTKTKILAAILEKGESLKNLKET